MFIANFSHSTIKQGIFALFILSYSKGPSIINVDSERGRRRHPKMALNSRFHTKQEEKSRRRLWMVPNLNDHLTF